MVALLESLDDDDWATPVPCTPGWTIRDVLSHVAGVTDDIANGRVEGAGTDPWTAAQVERWRDVDQATLIAQWNSQIDGVADLLEQFGEVRPPIDCWSHEQDVRHALGREPNVPDDFVGERDRDEVRGRSRRPARHDHVRRRLTVVDPGRR